MGFNFIELAGRVVDGEEDRAWFAVVGCGPQSMGADGCGPGTQKPRLEAIDTVWGLKSLDDLRSLKVALAAMVRRLDRIEEASEEPDREGDETSA